jgi:hypothetical protein
MAALNGAATTLAMLRFIANHSGQYTRDEIVKHYQPQIRRKKAQHTVMNLLTTQLVARGAADRLMPTAKGRLQLQPKKRDALTSFSVKSVERRDNWLAGDLEGSVFTQPVTTRVPTLRERPRKAPIDPLRTARRLYFEADLVYAPRLKEYLCKVRTRSSEFAHGERVLMFDLQHAKNLHAWLGRAIPVMESRK